MAVRVARGISTCSAGRSGKKAGREGLGLDIVKVLWSQISSVGVIMYTTSYPILLMAHLMEVESCGSRSEGVSVGDENTSPL